MRLVVALGGNVLDGGAIAEVAGIELAELILDGHELVIVHGNGPQAGELLLDQEARGPERAPPLTLDIVVAMTQAQLGYLLQREVEDVLVARDDRTDVVTVITEIVVDASDREFDEPSKPIGPWLDHRPDDGHAYLERDDGRWRRLVPSPGPRHLVERAALRAIVADGVVPICAGGGGVPVVREGSRLRGVSAVIDKDLSAALVAADLDADALVILTDVTHVQRHHGTPRPVPLTSISTGDAERLLPGLAAGSMRPKVRAAMRAASEDRFAVIARLGDARAALSGTTGTRVRPGPTTDGEPGEPAT